ncbi:Ger(x)C family spore germination protein [Clostridium brassicae]|uniref:Ger(X)C family spore germination protein n=1 Tax=Clostridium brassicae TaxID=2999072 RepID=A0ABT4D8X1_9CLOT|nr:Ger(x)C family spore germination protein [Clostridium brassicae]MCY6958753.1 Ger(x)C family spore germination protein [Clostridium brassicae]
MKANKKIILLLLICCLICCLMSGCWDKVEIDRKSFISTIAIDTGKDIDKEKEFKKIKPNEQIQEEELKKLSITYGFPDISELGPGKGGTAKEEFVTVGAYSMDDALEEMTARTSRSIHFGHTKLLILSEELLYYPETFKEVLDYLERKPSINKTMKVIVSKGKAEHYVKYKPIMEKNIETYITGLMENSNRNASILPITLNELLSLLHQNGNAIIPSIYYNKAKNEVNLSGVAMIKKFKLDGYLNEIETAGLELLRGKLKGGKYTIVREGHPVDFEISDINRKIALVDKDVKKLKFKVNLKLEGSLEGYTIQEEVFSDSKIKEMEKNFNDSIEKQCEKVARITQEKFSIDPIGFREYIEKFHPYLYKEVKDKWDEVYKNANIDVEVDTKIRRIGITK